MVGPLAGTMVYAMLPELAAGVRTTVSGASLAVAWYAVPYVVSLLTAAVLAHRWPPSTLVRVAYGVFAAGSLVCALAPTLWVLLLGRLVQGLANGFTTPVLLSLVALSAGEGRMTRAVGTYAGFQAAGQAVAPLVGGGAAAVDYRLGFAAFAAWCVVLVLATAQVERSAAARSLRGLWSPVLARAAGIAFLAYLAASTMMLIGALDLTDRFGLGPLARGLVVSLFGVAGLVSGSAQGRYADRAGIVRLGLFACLALAVTGVLGWLAPGAWLVGVALALAGAAAVGGRATASTMALRASPANPTGGTSLVLAAQFAAIAVVPAVTVFYGPHGPLAYLCATAAALGALVVVGVRAGPGRARG